MHEGDLRDFFDALSGARWTEIEPVLAADVVLEFPGRRFGGRFEGRRKVMVFLRRNQRMFRDGLRFEVRSAGVAGDRGFVEWTNRGTTRDGADYANRGVTVFVLRDARVAEIHDYLDTERLTETWPE